MSLLFGRERRAMSYQSVWGRGGTVDAGIGGGLDGPLALFSVFAAQRLVASQLASSPLHGMREKADGSRQRLSPQPRLLQNPSALGSVRDWKFRWASSVLGRGYAVGLVLAVDPLGWPTQVEWINPLEIAEHDGRIYWNGSPLAEGEFILGNDFVLPGRRLGISPLKALQLTVETGLEAQKFGRSWFKGGTTPGAILKNTQKRVDPEDAETVKQRFRASVRSGELFVTGSDWDYKTIAVSADQAQFLATIQATTNQVAAVYGVPPHKIGGELGTSMQYSTTEMEGLDFSKFTLRNFAVAFEESLSAALPRNQYASFNLDALLRADTKARYEAHAIALRDGWRSRNEVRRLEDEPPLPEGGDEYLRTSTPATATPRSERDS